MGGAGLASLQTTSVFFMNPALLPHGPEMGLGLFYTDGLPSASEHLTDLGASIIDNNPDAMFPGALGYVERRRSFDGGGNYNETYWNLSLGNFVADQFSVGVSVVYLVTDFENGPSHTQWDGVIGMLFSPYKRLGFAAVAYHFVSQESKIPEAIELAPKLALGLNYLATDYLEARLDLGKQTKYNSNNKWELHAGLRSHFNKFLSMALGFEADEFTDRKYYTGGFSFQGPRFQMDYALKISTKDSIGTLHSVDIRTPF